eukprot:Awhi_evm1s2502
MKTAREDLEKAKGDLAIAERNSNFARASELMYGTIPELERLIQEQERVVEGDELSGLGLMNEAVTADTISLVVSKSTGIPLDNLMKGT